MWSIISDSFGPTLALCGLLVYVIYKYGTSTYDYWEKRGIPTMKPRYPFLGNIYEVIFSLKTNIHTQLEIYNYFKKESFGGIFSLRTPVLLLKDPTLIERLIVKDMTSFYNRVKSEKETKRSPLSIHLLNLFDSEWKCLRQKLTPTFSSVKIKGMQQQFIDCADELLKNIDNYSQNRQPMEVGDAMDNFTIDVIASCAFGLNLNTLGKTGTDFRKIAKIFSRPPFLKKLRFTIRGQNLYLRKLLSCCKSSVERVGEKFFISLFQSTLAYREKNNINRHDFIQLLLELKHQDMKSLGNGELKDQTVIIDNNVIMSNALLFFIAGFETTSTTVAFCVYELARNQDIQKKAYQHVSAILKKHNNQFTYEAINEMTFLQQIISEALRMRPPTVEVKRQTTKEYTIAGTDITIPKGTPVIIPVYSIQNDPEYFPEPHVFKPERFDPTNTCLQKSTYMPFGIGHKSCIGKRFAETEILVVLSKLLSTYSFTLNSKTKLPLVYDPSSMLIRAKGGIWMDFQKRL